MPELPEVETVRSGLAQWAIGWKISAVEVLHPRAVRNNKTYDLKKVLPGRKITSVNRRGKYMWLLLDNNQALIVHLGMSGQVLLPKITDEDHKHLRVRLEIEKNERELHFIDQRTFGHMTLDDLDGNIPHSIKKIAPDIFEAEFSLAKVITKMAKSNAEIKKLLLDQSIMSGVGNIYADESLWRAKIHPERISSELTRAESKKIIRKCHEVMSQAIAAGGTSFDALYVNVNGESGFFESWLAVYGQNGHPCPRPKCQELIKRSRFMGRYSHFCPSCQPK